jgi:ParB family transcriptional regulator, chromosome partitioning protein
MTDTTSIALNKLTAWDGNVRKTAGADTALAELAASIAAHGLLQSLVVRNGKKGKFAVVAGGRRLQALQALAESGKIAADYAVPCQVVADDADATEISLAENAVREQMHPADEFEAFRDLSDKGLSAADVAARFGVTEAVVSKRLKLARVSPVILAAYRDGKLDLEQVMAFAITDDHKAQEKLLKTLRNMDDDPRSIRRALTDGEIPASHKVVKFVTLKAYEKAGGQIRRDLFAQDDEGVFILDRELLQTLAFAKLEKAADGLRKEGWKWVELRLEQDHSEWSHCTRMHPEPAPLPAKLAGELAALEQEYDTLETAWEANDDTEAEYPERLREISDRMDDINEARDDVWPAETLAIAGAVVRIGYNGKLDIDRGFVLPADRPKKAPATTTIERVNDDGTVETVEVAEAPSLPASLVESLTLHRTAAISAELVNRPYIALAALVHTLAAQTFLDSASGNTCFEIFARTKSLHAVEGTKAFAAVNAARETWGNQIPGSPDALWTWCLEQEQSVLLDLLAVCMARSVNAVRMKQDGADDPRLNHADRLAAALKLDMSAWFTPTAENYFTKVSKPRILEALTEVKGATAPAWDKAKKGELAAIAEREIAQSGWLPEPLRKAA